MTATRPVTGWSGDPAIRRRRGGQVTPHHYTRDTTPGPGLRGPRGGHVTTAPARRRGRDCGTAATGPFTVRDGAFHHPQGGTALVFEVAPLTVFGFGKGEPYSQTRYRFPPLQPSLHR